MYIIFKEWKIIYDFIDDKKPSSVNIYIYKKIGERCVANYKYESSSGIINSLLRDNSVAIENCGCNIPHHSSTTKGISNILLYSV